MPPVPGIEFLIQFIVAGLWNTGTKTATSFHMSVIGPGPYSVSDLDTLATAVVNAWAAHMCPVQNHEWVLQGVTTIDRTRAEGNQGQDFSSTTAGGVSGNPMSLNACALVRWKDTRHYKGGHSRQYVPGLSESDSVNGRDLVTLSAWETAIADFATAIDSGGPYGGLAFLNWVAPHYTVTAHHPAPDYSNLLRPPFIDDRIATQRRRLRKAAHH